MAKVPLGGLWTQKSKGGVEYLRGRLGHLTLLAFKNTRKRNLRAPDWNLYLVQENKDGNGDDREQRREPSLDEVGL